MNKSAPELWKKEYIQHPMSTPSRSTSSSLFPVYLIPSLPFHRRNRTGRRPSSLDKSTPSSEDPPSPPYEAVPGAPAPAASSSDSYLHGHVSRLRCARCAADLCLSSQIISKGFTGRHGRAYLVSPTPPAGCSAVPGRAGAGNLPNTHTHAAVPRQLVTGAHTVSDVSCAFCDAVVGWKYDGAEEESQRYKVGKFILETKRICTDSCWESGRWEEIVSIPPASPPPPPAPAGGSSRGGTFSLARGIFMDDDDDDDDEYDDPGISKDPTVCDPPRSATAKPPEHDVVEFDSQDEDECEDLFAGVWSPALAVRRRQARNFGGARSTLKGMAAVALRGR